MPGRVAGKRFRLGGNIMEVSRCKKFLGSNVEEMESVFQKRLVGHEVFGRKIKCIILKAVTKARRGGIWWRLGGVERGILSLALTLNIKFKSVRLLRAIVGIIRRISQLTSYMRKHYLLGLKAAYKTVEYATSVGYVQAREWLKDKIYIVWHGMILDPTTYTR
jgi:hypothetical protein